MNFTRIRGEENRATVMELILHIHVGSKCSNTKSPFNFGYYEMCEKSVTVAEPCRIPSVRVFIFDQFLTLTSA